MHVPWPTPRVLALAAGLVLVVGLLAGGAGLLAGAAPALGILLGAVGVLAASVTDVGARVRVGTALLAAASFGLGTLAAGHALLAGGAVAAAALVAAPLTVRAARTGTFLPVLAALGSGLPLGGARGTVTLWVALGALATVGLTTLLRVATPAQPVPRTEAGRHAVATALVAGTGVALTTGLGLGHGYWLVVAVAMVLAVSREETAPQATARVVGTVVGVVGGVVAVAVLPTPACLALAGVLTVLGLAWTVVRETRFVAGTTSATVVLVGSGGLVGPGAGLAAERLLLTAAGAGLAVAVVALLWRLDAADPTG